MSLDSLLFNAFSPRATEYILLNFLSSSFFKKFPDSLRLETVLDKAAILTGIPMLYVVLIPSCPRLLRPHPNTSSRSKYLVKLLVIKNVQNGVQKTD